MVCPGGVSPFFGSPVTLMLPFREIFVRLYNYSNTGRIRLMNQPLPESIVMTDTKTDHYRCLTGLTGILSGVRRQYNKVTTDD